MIILLQEKKNRPSWELKQEQIRFTKNNIKQMEIKNLMDQGIRNNMI